MRLNLLPFCALALSSAATITLEQERANFLKNVQKGAAALELEKKSVFEEVTPRDGLQVLQQAYADIILERKKALDINRELGLVKDITVQTEYGAVTGLAGTVNQFLGVPFAAPPLGDLRFKAPIPPSPWGSINATWWKNSCMQKEQVWAFGSGMSEDCLYLNIYTPGTSNKTSPPPPGGYPVMLFFFGGSFEFGSGNFILYDGVRDDTLVEDMIYVTTNYRINAFGFLAGDLLKAESPDGSVGTMGLQDQQAALRFVKNNIAAFGGNPSLTTIYGESAGGASVSNHLVSPRSRGLFQGAVIQSGSFSDWTAQPYNISSTREVELAKNLNCSNAPDVLACMRAANSTQVLNAEHDLTSGQLTWSPCIDGVVVLDDPRKLAAAGAVAPVNVMLGFNHDEGTVFNNESPSLNASDYVTAVESILGPALAAKAVQVYPAANYESPWWAISAMLRDSQMLCPGLDSAKWLTGASRNGTYSVHVYFYTQILFITDIIDIFKPLRCFHGSELASVFFFQIALWGVGEVSMATTFVDYWKNFASNGDPNVGVTVPQWTPWLNTSASIAEISTSPTGTNVTNIQTLQPAECAFWDANPVPENIIWG